MNTLSISCSHCPWSNPAVQATLLQKKKTTNQPFQKATFHPTPTGDFVLPKPCGECINSLDSVFRLQIPSFILACCQKAQLLPACGSGDDQNAAFSPTHTEDFALIEALKSLTPGWEPSPHSLQLPVSHQGTASHISPSATFSPTKHYEFRASGDLQEAVGLRVRPPNIDTWSINNRVEGIHPQPPTPLNRLTWILEPLAPQLRRINMIFAIFQVFFTI
jgi:hypothetical protein